VCENVKFEREGDFSTREKTIMASGTAPSISDHNSAGNQLPPFSFTFRLR